MPSPWRTVHTVITLNNMHRADLERRIDEMTARGYELITEPKEVTQHYTEYHYEYSTLHKRNFQGRTHNAMTKWVCKMKRKDADELDLSIT